MKRYLTAFRLFCAAVPFHPLCKVSRRIIMQQVFSYQPIFMLVNIIFQKLVCNNNIPADQLIEISYIIARKLTIVCNNLQCKIDCRSTGLAITKATNIINGKMPVKFAKHFLYLLVQFLQIRSFTKFVKKNGITFNFSNFKSYLSGIY